MLIRAQRVFFATLLTLVPTVALAQMDWQPTAPPLVTADNERWFMAGDAIESNGDFYVPSGARQFFNAYQMVRAGSFRGIPLYTDTTAEPNSMLFVPLAGQHMQPYLRRAVSLAEMLPQTPGEPTRAPAYDDAGNASLIERSPTEAPTDARELPIGTALARGAIGTSGRIPAAPRMRPARIETVAPPSGINGIWVNYEGRRWFAGEKALVFSESEFEQAGSYRGWPVYVRAGVPGTIYIASSPGHVTPYVVK